MKHLRKLFAVLAVFMLSVGASAESFTVNDITYSTINDYPENVYVSDCNYKSIGDINIPSSVEYNGKTYTVTSIGERAFNGCSNVTSVEIPSSVTQIGEAAFGGCTSLKSFIIPSSVSVIEKGAFAACDSLKQLTFEDGNEILKLNGIIFGYSGNISKLTTLHLGRNVTGEKLFSDLSKLTSVTFSNNVTSIPPQTFKTCSSLKTVSLSSSIKKIGASAFAFCDSLSSINLPKNLIAIEDKAFSFCYSLSSITLPNSLTNLGTKAFSFCKKIESINIPGSVNNIPDSCFYGCTALQNITIGNGVTQIGDKAFPFSFKNTIILPPSIASIGSGNFNGCKIIVSNGNLDWKDPEYQGAPQAIYILDGNIPNFSDGTYIKGQYFYVTEREKFITQTNADPVFVRQLIDRIVSTSYNYTGFPQGPNREGLSWSVGEFFKSLGINYTFENIQKTDCGHWTDAERVTFAYNDWSIVSNIYHDFTITPVPLKVTALNASKTYGDENPQFEVLLEGLVANDNSSNVLENLTYTTDATKTSNIGNYDIIPSATAKNYTLSFYNGTLSIQKAPLKAIVLDSEKAYGEINPTFSFMLEGLRNDDLCDDIITKQPMYTTAADQNSPVGRYPVSAEGLEFENYFVNDYVDGFLNVIKANATITAEDTSKIYGEQNPEFGFKLEGLKNGDDKSCLTILPQFKCEASSSSGCGDYSIVPFGAESNNYEIGYLPGNLSITKAPLNISIKDNSRFYGDANPEFEFVYSGFKGMDDATVLTKLPTIVSEANPHSPVGNYDVTSTGAEAVNYEISYKSGNLTIEPAHLTARAKDCSKTYGSENPAFVIQYNGFKNNDDESCLYMIPQVATNATVYSPVGSYLLSLSNGGAQNYSFEYENAVLTITKADLIGKVLDVSREYGSDNCNFAIEYSGFIGNDSESDIIKQPQFRTNANVSSNCGEYEVMAFGASAQNYDISYINGTLTVVPAPLVLKAHNETREYGDENPAFDFDVEGLKGNDTKESALQTFPVITTTANPSSNVGVYSISITGGSSKNYTLSYRSGTMTITKTPLSVIANDAERIYGDSNPTFVRSYLGFKLSDSESTAFSVLPRIECSANKTSDVGDYPITISGGTSRNYEIAAYENAILSVRPATATITASDKGRLYFEDNPIFDFTISGLRNSDTKACVTTLPQYNCIASKTSNAESYEVTPYGASAQNYVFEYKAGRLTVNKRDLTASVGNYSRIYGEDNPSFDVDYIGFVNNEDASVLTQRPSVHCLATPESEVGTYPITLTGGEATNYYISKYNSGNLTITKANQKIIWNQDLSNIDLYSQIELQAYSDANLPVTYEMSPNNVATLYSNAGKWYLDCYGSGAVNIRAVQNGDQNYNPATAVTKTLVVFGGGGSPSDPQIFLNVEEPGTLPSLIAENRKYQIKNLRLTGYLNGTDINFIREMCGANSYGNTTVGVLEALDISGCTIVSGGRSYYQSNRTSDNEVGKYMFYNCKVLTTLRLPESSTIIENYAFADCERLSVVSVPNGVKSFGIESFRNNISLLRIPMPTELERIGDMAFLGCNGLTEITVPSNVTYVGSGFVKDCQNIAQINVEVGNTEYASRDGVLFNSDIDELIIFPINHAKSDYSIPDGVEKIASYAFVNAKGLKSVCLPSSLLTIGKDAFIGCVNLTKLQVKALTPPICQNDCFDNISKTRCELQVPIGCRSNYWVAPVWSEFNKIVESDFSILNEVCYDDLRVEVINNKIAISGCPDGMTVRIYQIDGTLIYQDQPKNGEMQFESGSRGVHIIMIGDKTFKLVLK